MPRRRYVYTENGQPLPEPIEVSDDWRNAERRATVATEELVYGKLGTATDGTPIDSRSKHRAYMKANGLALYSDYSEDFRAKQKASRDRENAAHRKEAIVNAYRHHRKP